MDEACVAVSTVLAVDAVVLEGRVLSVEAVEVEAVDSVTKLGAPTVGIYTKNYSESNEFPVLLPSCWLVSWIQR